MSPPAPGLCHAFWAYRRQTERTARIAPSSRRTQAGIGPPVVRERRIAAPLLNGN